MKDSAAADPARLPAIVLAGLLAGPFLTMLDSSIVNVAIPSIAQSFNTDLATVQWTVSGYLLALASSLAASAWLIRRFGSRPVYVACMAGFTLASALCALAPDIQFLVTARVVQGLAGAALVPIAMSMTMNRSMAQASPRASMVPAMMLFLAPALGPTLGGILIHQFGWPAIFLVNLPFGLLGIIGALKIPDQYNMPPDRGARFDVVGLTMLAAGLGLALYGAGQGAGTGWLAAAVWPFWTAGLLLVVLYVVWAVRRADPVLNLDVLRDRQSVFALSVCVLVSVVSFSALFLIPVLMQAVQGYDAFQAGLALLPQGLAMGVGTVLGQYVTRSRRVRLSVVVGSAILAVSTSFLLQIVASTPAWVTALVLCGRGIAFGLIVQPLLMGMLGSLPQSEATDASTLFNVVQRLAGSFGIGLLASLFAVRASTRVQDALSALHLPADVHLSMSGSAARNLGSLPPALRAHIEDALGSAFHDVVWVLVALSALGVLLALGLRDPGEKRLEQPQEQQAEYPV